MKHNANGVAALLALVVAVGPASSAASQEGAREQKARDRFAGARDLIRTRMARDRVPSVAVAVAQHGKIVWEEGFGLADPEKGTPATPHTVYRICSISKVFTASAVMILVERGKVGLDRPVNDFLGEAKLKARVGSARDATVRRLANHTSGLPTHDQCFFEGERYRSLPSDRMETQIARYGNLAWKPGERPCYSNLAFGILSHVVSRQSGMSFGTFMHKEVFLPLGMKRSSVRLSDKLKPFAAVGYAEGKPVPLVTNSTPGAGEVWSSAHDLVRFGMFHLKDRLPDQKAILTDKSLDAMQVTTSKVPDSDFGIGWGTDEDYRGTGYRAVGHHGGNAGWHAFLLLIPSEHLAVAVLSNANGDLLDPVADAIVAALVPEYGKRRAAALAKRNDKGPQAGAAESRGAFKPPANLVGEWKGRLHTFEGTIPTSFWFDAKGGAHAQIGDQPRRELTRVAFARGTLTADLKADLITADTRRLPPGILEVELTLRDDTLQGVLYANSLFGNAAWGGYRLNHWVELKKRP